MPRGIYKRNKNHLQILKRHIETIRKKFPDEFKKTCIERYLQGETATSIAKDMGCSSYIIRYWLKKKGYKLNKATKNTNHLNKLTETEKAYFAGLLDGEGSIVIIQPKIKSPWFQISITNTNKPVIDFVKEKLGGHLTLDKRENRQNSKPCWKWNATTHEAFIILKQLIPYLIIKKEKAIETIKFFNY